MNTLKPSSDSTASKYLSLIVEANRWKNKYEVAIEKNRHIDSLLSVSYTSNEQKIREITRLQIDTSFHSKELKMCADFSEKTVKPFYESQLVSAKKEAKKLGFRNGVLATVPFVGSLIYLLVR